MDGHRSRPSFRVAKLAQNLPPLQALKTIAHEVAHALMHRDGAIERRVAEFEAESCAFLVCHALGLDTSRYSFAYLAAWASDPSEILPAAERANKIARSVLETLEGEGASAPSLPLGYLLGANSSDLSPLVRTQRRNT